MMDMTTANLKTATPPSYSFKVPATAEGKRFIAQLREYANYPHVRRIRTRANGPRVVHAEANGARKARYFQDLPMRYAEEIRVYLDARSWAEDYYQNNAKRARDLHIEACELRERLDAAAQQVEAKDARIAGLMRAVDDLAQERHDLQGERDKLRAERLAYCAGAAQLANDLQAELNTIPQWLRRLCAWLRRKA